VHGDLIPRRLTHAYDEMAPVVGDGDAAHEIIQLVRR
jgi:hypothetical protein